MIYDYSNASLRNAILSETEDNQNKERKAISLAQFEIYKERLLPYVRKYLEGFYSEESIKELPIIASINLCKRIIDKEASVYSRAPERMFVGLTEEQELEVRKIYNDMRVDVYFKKANRYFKLQEQNHLQVIPSKGKLKLRSLLSHQLDVVPDPQDPETADAYIVKGFDRSHFVPKLSETEDGVNQTIADADDYKGSLKQAAWWSDDFNMITDQNGAIISGPDISNPLKMKPFIEIADAKDSEYWVRKGAAVTDFTIQFNGSVTDLGQIVRMQGFSQAVFKGSQDMIPENIQIGPNFVIKLPIDPNNPTETDFGFANPSPDIAGSIQFVEMILSAFLSSRGLDASLVNTKGNSKTFSSGLERLLSMIEMFEPSKEDFSIFENAEKQLFEIVKRYINTYNGTGILNYSISAIPEDATVVVKFSEPQSVVTEAELIESTKMKVEMGVMSEVEAIMSVRGVDRDKAEEIKKEIEAENTRLVSQIPAEDVNV